MTDTKMRDDAIREAARNHAMDEYFKARPQLMRTRHEECLFEAGFDRAWQAAQSEQSAELERLRKDAERMRNALVDIADWTDRYTKPGHPVSTVARAAIAGEKK